MLLPHGNHVSTSPESQGPLRQAPSEALNQGKEEAALRDHPGPPGLFPPTTILEVLQGGTESGACGQLLDPPAPLNLASVRVTLADSKLSIFSLEMRLKGHGSEVPPRTSSGLTLADGLGCWTPAQCAALRALCWAPGAHTAQASRGWLWRRLYWALGSLLVGGERSHWGTGQNTLDRNTHRAHLTPGPGESVVW